MDNTRLTGRKNIAIYKNIIYIIFEKRDIFLVCIVNCACMLLAFCLYILYIYIYYIYR